MTWWVVAASFLGAVIGATVPAWVDLRGQHQQARTEWSQRLDRAITAITSSDTATREIGKELLADLIESDLGTVSDRELARRLMRSILGTSRAAVDELSPLRDNDDEPEEA